MRAARQRQFAVVVVWRFDRFARSVKRLVMALEEFQSLGIGFVSHQEALDTSTPMGKAMFKIRTFLLPTQELNLHRATSSFSLPDHVLHVLLVVADVFDQLRVGE